MDRISFLASGVAVAFNGPILGAGRSAMLPIQTSARGATLGPQSVPEWVLRTPIVGEVRRFDGALAPPRWAFCDGRILAIAAYPKLFAVLGKTAGGNGRTTFALPRLTDARFIIAIDGIVPRSPAELAGMRRGPDTEPDVSVPGVRVLARPRLVPPVAPIAEPFPLAWPGTIATPALFAEQNRARRNP